MWIDIARNCTRGAAMQDLLQYIEWGLKEVVLYGRHFSVAAWRPATCATALKLSIQQAIIFLFLSALLNGLLLFPIMAATPPLVQSTEGIVLWLPLEEERAFTTSVSVALGPLGIADTAFALLIWIASTTFVGWGLGGFRSGGRNALNIGLQMTAPVCAARIMFSASFLAMFWLASWSLLPNLFFLGVAALYALTILYSFLVPLRAIRAAASISWISAAITIMIAEVMTMGVYFFANPVTIYRNLTSTISENIVRAEALVRKSDELLSQGRLDEALLAASSALKLTPNNLNAQATVVAVRMKQCVEDPECSEEIVDEKQQSSGNASEVLKATLNELDDLAQIYAKYPSVQLYLANQYNLLGQCDAAEVAYTVVLQSNSSLPYDKYAAAAVLDRLKRYEFDEAIKRQLQIWELPSSSLEKAGLIIRILAATQMVIGQDMAINDLAFGTNFQSLLFSGIHPDPYMAELMANSPCAQGAS
jgi:tetratricopeptide (TPR) repeat protein